jgi:hypothetical protein
MERVKGRWRDAIYLGSETVLTLPDIDEVLFGLPAILDYRVTVSRAYRERVRLRIDVQTVAGEGLTDTEVFRALNEAGAIRNGVAQGSLEIAGVCFTPHGFGATSGVGKRRFLSTDT